LELVGRSGIELFPVAANYAITVTAEDFDEPLAQMAEIDLSPELENMKDISSSFDSPQLDQSEVSEPAMDSSVTDSSDFGPRVIEQDSISQINSICSENGSAMKSFSDQVGKMTADCFGSKAKGRRFVFVVDNSNSMTRGRFHTALNELVRTIEQMESDQYFYVIFR